MASPRIVPTGVLGGIAGKDGSNVLPTDTAIKQAIENPASQTAVALSASTAAQIAGDVPALVTTGVTAAKPRPEAAGAPIVPGIYEPALARYNFKPGNTRKLRAALARAVNGYGLASIVAAGDSETFGFGTTNQVKDAWPQQLARRAAGADGGPTRAGTGLVTVCGAVGGTYHDSRWTIGAGWTNGAFYYQSSGSAKILTYTPQAGDPTGTIVEIWTFGNSAAFTYSIDGAAAVTVTPNGASAVQTITVTGLSNTTHTVVITSNAANVYINGVNTRNATGLQIHNLGMGSSTASAGVGGWTGVNFFEYRGLAVAMGQDASILALGVNDIFQGIALATYKAAYLSLATALKAVGDVILLVQVPPGTNTGTGGQVADGEWATFVAAQYEIADTLDLPLIDAAAVIGSEAAGTANGLYINDHLHPNSAGHALIAGTVLRAIAP